MGCSQSAPREGTSTLVMSGTFNGAATLGQGALKVGFAALTRGQAGKDQDRFFARSPAGSGSLVCGICDGHSLKDSRGQEHAEAAAKHLAFDIWPRLKDKFEAPNASQELTDLPPQPPAALGQAVTDSFLAHQDICMKAYELDVATPILDAKKKIEEELGEVLPLELPQEGGTTATAMVLDSTGLLTAWVGDSRAILAAETEAEAGGNVISVSAGGSSAAMRLRVTRFRKITARPMRWSAHGSLRTAGALALGPWRRTSSSRTPRVVSR